jgi:prepilin-type N-terminal cleavage/methylation domain-containing protein
MYKKGFSLIEVIITIGILFLLTSAMIFLINPAEKILSARDGQRRVHVEALYGATSHYFFGNKAFPDCVTLSAVDIISCDQLVPDYPFELPEDPICGSEIETGYHIKKDEVLNEIGIKAICAEGKEEITVGAWSDE